MATGILKSWIMAARLRTLPLSVSGIIVGSALGLNQIEAEISLFESSIFWLAIITTLGLQILSNFANDYGDGVKGTDNDERIGPKRAIQSGLISQKAMKLGIVMTAIITLAVAVLLIYQAFGKENFGYSILFFGLGLASVVAAIKYTVGNSAYGYRGLGDVFVFIFFGLVSTIGSYFLFTKTLDLFILFPAITIGCLSTAVLNLNNLRDIESDKNSEKNTLVVKLGWERAKLYHQALGVIAVSVFIGFISARFENWYDLLPLLPFIYLAIHFNKVRKTEEPMLLDPELKKVALCTFFFSFLLALSIYL